MTTPSPRLGLALPGLPDRFSTADVKANWDKIDLAPGTHICTSTTRPTSWTTAQTGRKIIETNTGLEYMWTGTAWSRISGGQGILRLTGGTPAVADRTTNFSTSSTTRVRAVTLSGVVVPAGNRTLMMVATFHQADNNSGAFEISILRSATNDSGPVLGKMTLGAQEGRGQGATFASFEKSGLNPGTYDFSLQVRSFPAVGGTSWLYGDVVQPIQLLAIEL